MIRRIALVALGLLAACGGEPDDEVTYGFKSHALQCEVPGMQARLDVSGVDGVCPLSVNADRTVTGVCRPVPAGEIRDFRLVYFYDLGGVEVDLATVIARLDLRGETRDTVRLEFPADRVFSDIDDDSDGRTNIEEFCAGTNPRDRNS